MVDKKDNKVVDSIEGESNNRDNKGRFIQGHNIPGPGKPKGLQEKYNLVREQLLDVLIETKAMDKVKRSVKGNKSIKNRDLHFLIEKVISILPKETKQDMNIDGMPSNNNIVVLNDRQHKELEQRLGRPIESQGSMFTDGVREEEVSEGGCDKKE